MNSPLSYEILDYPGGFAKVDFGLIHIDIPQVSGSCQPFDELCIIKIFLLICLPKFNENDLNSNFEQNKMNQFRTLQKSYIFTYAFFLETKSIERLQCHIQLSDIQSKFRRLRAFYLNPLATFETPVMDFNNKLLLFGVLLKGDKVNGLKIINECSIFKTDIKKNQLIKCFNETSIVQRFKSFSHSWSVWAKVKCLYQTNDDDCSPKCVQTNRNSCNAGLEICYEEYSAVPVSVTYTTRSMKTQNKFIKRKVENRCLYYNPCLNINTCQLKNCFSLQNGSFQCSTFKLEITNSKPTTMFKYNVVHALDELKCGLIANDLTVSSTIILKPIKNIDSVSSISQNVIQISSTPDFQMELHLKCDLVFSSYSPVFSNVYKYIIFKIPNEIYFNVQNENFIHTNQKIWCISNAIPLYLVKYYYSVPSGNFNPNLSIFDRSYIVIPLFANLGPITINCTAVLYMQRVDLHLTLSATMQSTLTHVSNLNWGLEEQVIYQDMKLTCHARNFLMKNVIIKQLGGPSILESPVFNYYKIHSDTLGGKYNVLCIFYAIKDLGIIYYRHYSFYRYRKPNISCIFAIPGYARIQIFCLHNGYPSDAGITKINVFKILRLKVMSLDSVIDNKIMINYDNFMYNYRLNCQIDAEEVSLKLDIRFQLISQNGILIRGKHVLSNVCKPNVVKMNDFQSSEKFYLDNPYSISFTEYKVCIAFCVFTTLISVVFIVLHMHSLDKDLATESTVNSLSRRHCIMRLYKKLNELALFNVKQSRHVNLETLKAKFEAYKGEDDDNSTETTMHKKRHVNIKKLI